MTFPPIARVRQVIRQPEVVDVPGAVAEAIRSSRICQRVRPGGSVALTAGSRGIAGIAEIARSAVETLGGLGFRPVRRRRDGEPRGGRTESGQKALLAELGVTENSVGCPIRSEMETVILGQNSFGLPIHFDANALGADGIVLLNRIKPHTSFTGRFESGLVKMLTIGLGKRQGAEQVHKLGLPGLLKLLPEVGAFLLERTPVALGLAILENAEEKTARIVGVEPEAMLEVEPKLLDEARGLMGRLPFDQIDVLMIGELGQELQRDRARPQRDRSPAGRDDARPPSAGRHPPGRPRPLARDPRQRDRDRPGRLDHRAIRRGDRPDADAGQLHDLELPHQGEGSAEPADRPRCSWPQASTPAGGSTRARPGWS